MRALARLLAGGLLAGALLPVACADRAATAIVVAISSEAEIPRELDSLSLKITRGGSVRFAQTYAVDRTQGTVNLPGTITVKPRDSEEPGDPVKIEVSGNVRDTQVVLRTARMSFVEEKQKLLRLTLRYSCLDIPLSCAEGQTCIGGRCADDFIDTSKLPDLGAAPVFPTGTDGCFDESESSVCTQDRLQQGPLPAALAVPVGGTGTAADPLQYKCRFATSLAPGDARAADLNVFVLWHNQINQERPRVLESDSPEGWSFQKDTAPLTVELADGLCDAVLDGRISRVSYNLACPSKNERQPLCFGPETEDTRKFFDDRHACHRCTYFREKSGSAPPSCRTAFEQAIASTQGEAESTIARQASECLYDGRYNGLEECNVVRSCFFGALAPFLQCQGAACDQFPNLTTWSGCLAGWQPLAPGDPTQGDCATECGPQGEHADVCQ